MRLDKRSNFVGFNIQQPGPYIKDVDSDLKRIFEVFKGRVRFGDGTNSTTENISGEWQNVADTGTANTEFSVTHGLGAVPIGFLVLNINKGGVVYASGTSWTSTTIYLKCTTANTTLLLFLLK